MDALRRAFCCCPKPAKTSSQTNGNYVNLYIPLAGIIIVKTGIYIVRNFPDRLPLYYASVLAIAGTYGISKIYECAKNRFGATKAFTFTPSLQRQAIDKTTASMKTSFRPSKDVLLVASFDYYIEIKPILDPRFGREENRRI